MQVATVAAIDANGREKISLSSLTNTSGVGPKRHSVSDSGKSRSTWQTRGSSLTSSKTNIQNKVNISCISLLSVIQSFNLYDENKYAFHTLFLISSLVTVYFRSHRQWEV